MNRKTSEMLIMICRQNTYTDQTNRELKNQLIRPIALNNSLHTVLLASLVPNVNKPCIGSQGVNEVFFLFKLVCQSPPSLTSLCSALRPQFRFDLSPVHRNNKTLLLVGPGGPIVSVRITRYLRLRAASCWLATVGVSLGKTQWE